VSPEFCDQHAAVVADWQRSTAQLNERLKELTQELKNLPATLATMQTESRGLAADVAEVKVTNKEQWTAINSCRRLSHIGMGIALAASIVFPAAVSVIITLVMLPAPK